MQKELTDALEENIVLRKIISLLEEENSEILEMEAHACSALRVIREQVACVFGKGPIRSEIKADKSEIYHLKKRVSLLEKDKKKTSARY